MSYALFILAILTASLPGPIQRNTSEIRIFPGLADALRKVAGLCSVPTLAGIEKNYLAQTIRLTSTRPDAILVSGANADCACGATGNCAHYVFVKTGNGYRLVLGRISALGVKVLPAST